MKVVHLGNEEARMDVESIEVQVHQFSELQYKAGEILYSPTFRCHGLEWKLRLNPARATPPPGGINGISNHHNNSGGMANQGNDDDGTGQPGNAVDDDMMKMSMYLHVDQGSWKDTEACTVKYSISIPKVVIYWEPGIWTFRKGVDRGHGCSVSIRRQEILAKGCVNDTLSIVVEIQLLHEARPRFWTPNTNFNRDRLKALKNEIMADVTFLVGSKSKNNINSSNNNSSIDISGRDNANSSKDETKRHQQQFQEEIRANSTILLLAAPFMKDLLDSGMSDSGTQSSIGYGPFKSKRMNANIIPLPDVDPSHFRSILRFIYADDTSFIDNHGNQTHLQDMLKTANQFGCWRLKLVIEHRLIRDHLVYGNCVELLLFAHKQYCSMLKEAAIKMVCQYWSSLLHRSNFLQLTGELLKEIHEYSTGESTNKEDEFSKMSVGELYEWLEHDDDVYLECDMSRPMLLSLIRKTMEAREKKFERIS